MSDIESLKERLREKSNAARSATAKTPSPGTRILLASLADAVADSLTAITTLQSKLAEAEGIITDLLGPLQAAADECQAEGMAIDEHAQSVFDRANSFLATIREEEPLLAKQGE